MNTIIRTALEKLNARREFVKFVIYCSILLVPCAIGIVYYSACLIAVYSRIGLARAELNKAIAAQDIWLAGSYSKDINQLLDTAAHGRRLLGVFLLAATLFTVLLFLLAKEQARAAREMDPMHCSRCGYSLRGSPKRRCSECGHEAIRCPECGQESSATTRGT